MPKPPMSSYEELLEEDPLNNVNLSSFYHKMADVYVFYESFNYFTTILKIVYVSLLIALDIYIITIITTTPALKTKINHYVIYYAANHIVHCLTKNIVFELMYYIGVIKYLPFFIFEICFFLESLSIVLMFLTAIGFEFEWYCSEYNNILSPTTKLISKYFPIIFYSLSFLVTVIDSIVTFNFTMNYNQLFSHCFYLIILALVTILNISRYFKKTVTNKNVCVYLSMVTVYFWVPLFIYDTLLGLTYGSYIILHSIVLFTFFIPEYLSFSVPIAIIALLLKYDKHFYKTVVIRTVWISGNKHKFAEEDIVNEDDDVNAMNETNVFNV